MLLLASYRSVGSATITDRCGQAEFMNADGGPDVIKRLKLSGEPVIPELETEYGDEPDPPMPLLKFYDWILRLKDYRERYQDYWMSTSEDNDEGMSDAP